MSLIVIGVLILLIWLYVMLLRPILVVRYPQFGAFAEWEQTLYKRSRTVLVARSYQIAGWIVGVQALLAQAGVDTTPFTSQLTDMVPEKYRALVVSGGLIITGIIFVKLRKMTANPVSDQPTGM